jgi:thiamine-phosphate pyrophosphorylase
VVEEFLRFVVEDHHLAAACKRLRHDLVECVTVLPRHRLHAARDIVHDVGAAIRGPSEYRRADLVSVVAANWSRVEQSLRSLEEYIKVLAPRQASALESLRYRAYALERSTTLLQQSLDRLASARLYVLLDGRSSIDEFKALAESLLAGPVDIVQLRDKELSDRELLARARLLREMTRKQKILFIMNDRVDLATITCADGVHLGQDEVTVKDARVVMGVDALIGVSTHNVDQARQAVLDGANYLGCGPTFESASKQFQQFPGLNFLRQVSREIRLPAFAIGGIDLSNVRQVCDAGFSRVAVCHSVINASDPADAARRLREAVAQADRGPGEIPARGRSAR